MMFDISVFTERGRAFSELQGRYSKKPISFAKSREIPPFDKYVAITACNAVSEMEDMVQAAIFLSATGEESWLECVDSGFTSNNLVYEWCRDAYITRYS